MSQHGATRSEMLKTGAEVINMGLWTSTVALTPLSRQTVAEATPPGEPVAANPFAVD